MLTSETPFAGSFEVPAQSTAWLWLEVRFESAGARLDSDGSVRVETGGQVSESD